MWRLRGRLGRGVGLQAAVPTCAGRTWVLLFASGLAALVFQGATIGGLSMSEAARVDVLREVLRTEFGRWWVVQMGCAAALAVPVWALVARRPLWGVRPSVWIAVTAVLSIALALATALNGHARTVWHAAVLVPAFAVHLLAGGVWAGGPAALVALVPGRSLALAEKGPVNQEQRAGTYTVQLFIDATAVGDNQVHVTFVKAQGLAAAEVTSTAVSLDGQPLAMRLISPGRFLGDTSLRRPGRYRLAVTTPSAPGPPTTFDLRLFARGD